MKGKEYRIKSLGSKIDDVDTAGRKVAGYLSAFDVVDSDRDVIQKGAFLQSIKMRGPESETNRKIAFLKMHDWNKQIGRFDELYEDNYGLKFVATLGRTTLASDALLDYQDGILREHSIGFSYIPEMITYDEKQDLYNITEVKLYEGSAVTFGANSFTPVTDVSKGLDKEKYFSDINTELNDVISALKGGKGSDERLYNLEMRLRVLQSKINSLNALGPSDRDTSTEQKETEGNTSNLDLLRLILS